MIPDAIPRVLATLRAVRVARERAAAVARAGAVEAQLATLRTQVAAAEAHAEELGLANAVLHEALAAAEVARRAAEAANQAKAQFLAMMTDEFSTPLDAIQGSTERLSLGLRGPVTDAQQADYAYIRRANRRLAALVTDLLAFAWLEAGHVELAVADVAVRDVLADLELLLGPQLADKALAFGHDGGALRGSPEPTDPPQAAGPLLVRADPERVRQILLHLLTNAVTRTDAGGRVAVACEPDGTAGVVRLRVADTGRGIAPDRLASVFEPLGAADRPASPERQHEVGLGLPISRELARAMGGDLTAESVPGVGSTFTLTLPAAPRPHTTPNVRP